MKKLRVMVNTGKICQVENILLPNSSITVFTKTLIIYFTRYYSVTVLT